MPLQKPSFLHTVKLNPNLAFPLPRASKDAGSRCRRKSTYSFNVTEGLDLMKKFQVCQVIHIDFVLQNDHNSVTPEFHCPNLTPEGKLSNTTALVIIPDHNLIGRVTWRLATSNQRENGRPKQHLHNSNPCTIEIPPDSLRERIAVVDAESRLCTA
jgi:hypothetical protein